ncbi:MAG: carboxylesterase family protein [Bacteroidetes bacterium]|nr:carboxylesterase family protein [Bacteroidota bacterium]
MRNKLLLFCILILFVFPLKAQIVTTQFGQIQGGLNGTIYQFLGIPFAKPPVDTLRWKAPLNPNNWSGVINTVNFSPVCPQRKFDQTGATDTIVGDEDCLYLNVWTPQIINPNLPVMVFIHGGGNQQGSASEVSAGTQMFFGKNLAERGNAVVVTIQYRLGPLGFLVHPGLEPENINGVSGNYAVLDQILALTWVKNNIANFGGDTNKVMIFGESAGGVDVGNLLLTPLASGLFQRACIESAVPVIDDYLSSKNKGISYVDSFTTVGNDVQKIAYMRSLPSDSLVRFETPPISGGAVGMGWRPVLDNVVFHNLPYQGFQSGSFNKVPLIIGSNSDEMSLSVPPTVLPIMVTALINSTVPAAFQAQATSLYPPGTTNTEAKASYIGILTDAQFTATARRAAQCISQNQTEPVYRYFFTHKHTIPALAVYGSYHGMELFYVFNTWENAPLGSGPLFSAQDDSVQFAMMKYWSNFANTGNPNGIGLVNWPQYQSSTDCYLEIKATPNGSQCGLRTAKSDFWDDVAGFVPCASSLNIENIDSKDWDLSIFPNPTNNNLTIQSKQKSLIEILNIQGQLLETINCENDAITLNLSNFAKGTYLIKAISVDRIRVKKFIKE